MLIASLTGTNDLGVKYFSRCNSPSGRLEVSTAVRKRRMMI
jgi:hypothetical protein